MNPTITWDETAAPPRMVLTFGPHDKLVLLSAEEVHAFPGPNLKSSLTWVQANRYRIAELFEQKAEGLRSQN